MPRVKTEKTRHEYYLYCTADKYSLPIYITASIPEMAELTGLKLNTLMSKYSLIRHGKMKSNVYDIVRM